MKKGRCRIETTDPVGMRIKELIAQYSTMTEVSLQLDVPYKVVRWWIVGDMRPQGKALEKLAKMLNTSTWALLDVEQLKNLSLDDVANIAVFTYSGTQWASYGKLKCYIDTHGGQLPPRPKREGGQCEKA